MPTKPKKFIAFDDGGPIAGGTTLLVTVRTAEGGNILGQIRWFPAWRRYVYYPFSNTLFDVACLREIADYMEKMMAEHTPVRTKKKK